MGDEVHTENPRQQLVESAIRFLENPKVQSTSAELKKSFLKKKGLTDLEISLAFDQMKPSSSPLLPVGTHMHSTYPVYYNSQTSLGAKLRDFLNILLLIGGVSYGVRYLWKKYIRPWLLGQVSEPSPQQVLLRTSQTLLSSLLSLQQSISNLQTTLEKFSLPERRPNSDEFEIKKEIISLKGLILSSSSFPPNPSLSPPCLPSWQLERTEQLQPEAGPGHEQAHTKDDEEKKAEMQAGGGHWEESSGNASSSSEIELLGPDSSGEEGTGEEVSTLKLELAGNPEMNTVQSM